MKLWVKVLLGISLSLMCIFTCIGYALTDVELNISGNAFAEPPRELFIYEVSGGNYVDPTSLAYTGTVVNSKVTLRRNSSGAYEAVYDLTLFNNTGDTYYYVAMARGSYTTEDGTVAAYDNENVEMTVNVDMGYEIAPGATATITVTAKLIDKSNTSNLTLSSIINYQFSTTKPENKDEAAISGVLTRFPEILNDATDYKTLTDAMNANTTHPQYIGNAVGLLGWNDDVAAVENLFGVTLELNIDGENKPVAVSILRANVDGDESTGVEYRHKDNFISSEKTLQGGEMILFMTAADVTSVRGGTYVDTYAVAFTKSGDGEWHQIGQMYKGQAQTIGYALGTTLRSDSINPSTWRGLDGNGNRVNSKTLSVVLQEDIKGN